jgi:hypothetical protein
MRKVQPAFDFEADARCCAVAKKAHATTAVTATRVEAESSFKAILSNPCAADT